MMVWKAKINFSRYKAGDVVPTDKALLYVKMYKTEHVYQDESVISEGGESPAPVSELADVPEDLNKDGVVDDSDVKIVKDASKFFRKGKGKKKGKR